MRYAPGGDRYLFSLWFYAGFFALTAGGVVLFPLLFFVLFFSCRFSAERTIRKLIWCYGRLFTRWFSFFVPFSVEWKTECLPRQCIVVANHCSSFDPYFFSLLPFDQSVFVVRGWPFRIPCFGLIMQWAGYIDSDSTAGGDFLARAQHCLSRGESLAIFPEGTRSTGRMPGRFRMGAFRAALNSGIPILPLCIDGMGDVLPKGRWLLRQTPVRVSIFPPVDPECFRSEGENAHRTMARHVRQLFTDALAQNEMVHA